MFASHYILRLAILGLLLVVTSCSDLDVPQNAPTAAPSSLESPTPVLSATPAPGADSGDLLFGKYGCTSSTYSGGEIEYIPRGTFEISPDGKYTYFGFETPSQGSFSRDSAGSLLFAEGYFNDGEAKKTDRPNKFFLVFPTIPDQRWTCGYQKP